MYATAVALTTGTFTPVPENYVTPVLNYPSPPAENVATAAARSLAATAAAESGIPTPTRHPNAVDAIYVYATETPQNQETAIALIEEQNRNAVTTGTPTPTPWNLVVITAVPQPSPTPIPLFIPDSQLTPTPTATPTRELTSQDLAQFQNKILFLSDRSGSTETWVLDPSTGGVIGMLTDLRIHQAARERYLTLSPDGRQQAIVQGDGNLIGNTSNPVLQIKIHDLEYGTIRQITSIVNAVAYDPTWSPNGDRIAYVATESGGDEIYVIPLDTGTPQRLTFNTWEWDKHPTWSPDASQIVFYSNREAGRRQLWIMNADGSNQRNLSPSDYNDWDPVWVR
jgi:dipeptidyl aminopeptidase/acylaminoacyl peptidase